jgi:muconolactone delta-isomerase
VDRRERERIMGEHQPRGLSERERREAERLAADLEGSPVSGAPLPRRLRNFSPSVEGYARSVAGPPAYARRLRQIEDEIEEHVERLRAARQELHREVRDPGERARRWRELAGRWSFHAVNDLIEKHNRWYPVEARLAMNPRTGDFVPVGGKPYRLEPLDAAWVLECFPAGGPHRLAA